ncbi:MAG: helix-turn-helix domain-containing protein [bacterium]|nr:helix-turn-helix domain-containing protein [bacterium]
MNNQLIYNQLIEFGLDDIEAKTYLCLLELGPRTPLQLSRETNINRSRIYRYIEKMMEKSLIEETNDTWGKKLKASPPQNLQLYIAKKEDEIKKGLEMAPGLIHTLLNFPSKLQSSIEIKHYKGIEGLKQMLWNRLSAHKEIVSFGYETMNEIVGKSFAEKIREEQVERKIIWHELENVPDRGKYWYTNVTNWNKYYDSYCISPKILKIKHYVSIFNNIVSIISWQKREQIGIEINDSSLAEMQKQIFWHFWDIGKKNFKKS